MSVACFFFFYKCISFPFLPIKTDTFSHLSFNEDFVNWPTVRAHPLISSLKGLKKYTSSEACCSVWHRAVPFKINQLYLNAILQAHHIFRKKKKKITAVLPPTFFFFSVSVSYSIIFIKVPSISAVRPLLRLPRMTGMSLMGKVRSKLEC